jgi:hypothetical protein
MGTFLVYMPILSLTNMYIQRWWSTVMSRAPIASSRFADAPSLHIRTCSSREHGVAPHKQIASRHNYLITPTDIVKHAGSIQKWSEEWASLPGPELSKRGQCWRYLNGAPICSGAPNSTAFAVLVAFPRILIFTLESRNYTISGERHSVDDGHLLWDFPSILKPYGSRRGQLCPKYELVGRIIHDANHFTLRARWPKSRYILGYDDMHSGGKVEAYPSKGNVKELLSGAIAKTSSVIYLLDGDDAALEHLNKSRLADVQAKHAIRIGVWKADGSLSVEPTGDTYTPTSVDEIKTWHTQPENALAIDTLEFSMVLRSESPPPPSALLEGIHSTALAPLKAPIATRSGAKTRSAKVGHSAPSTESTTKCGEFIHSFLVTC